MSHQFYFSPHILDHLAVPRVGFDVVQDMAEPHLRMYITSRGVKTFFVRKRVRGRDIRIIIGRYPEIEIDSARARVLDILTVASEPVKIKNSKILFSKLLDQFVAKKIKRSPPNRAKLVRTMRRVWGDLYNKNISDITASHLEKIHNEIARDRGVPLANRMREVLRSVFAFAVDNGYCDTNPAVGLRKIKESRRVSKLDADGLRAIHDAAWKIRRTVHGAAFLMMIYGFENRSKILSMKWADMDFNNDAWGASPLSDRAVVLLRDMPQMTRWVFPSRGRHLTDPRASWRSLCKSAGVAGVQMSDIKKFLMRGFEWTANFEGQRREMNRVLDETLISDL